MQGFHLEINLGLAKGQRINTSIRKRRNCRQKSEKGLRILRLKSEIQAEGKDVLAVENISEDGLIVVGREP